MNTKETFPFPSIECKTGMQVKDQCRINYIEFGGHCTYTFTQESKRLLKKSSEVTPDFFFKFYIYIDVRYFQKIKMTETIRSFT